LFEFIKASCLSLITDTKNKSLLQADKETTGKDIKLEMWANAQPDGRPAEYRWRPLFNAAKFG